MYYIYMDYETFKACVRRTGLEIKEFAGLIGMNHRSISNYSKSVAIPEHLALIVLMMVELRKHDIDYKVIFDKLNKMGRQAHKRREGGFRGQTPV
jgi:predicted transcriptional regulator